MIVIHYYNILLFTHIYKYDTDNGVRILIIIILDLSICNLQ